MKNNLKKLLEFHSFKEFYAYVDLYMNNIHIEVVDASVGEIEVRLRCKDCIIGIWRDHQQYGFIEEYRYEERIINNKFKGKK